MANDKTSKGPAAPSPDSAESTEKSKSSNKLAWAGWFLAIPGAIFAIIQTYDWATKSSGPQLVTSAEAGPFFLPPQFTNYFELLEVVRNATKTKTIPEEHKKFIDRFERLKSVTVVRITNDGELAATKVRLQTKSEGVAKIEWDDGKTKTADFNNDIEIGTLEIKKSVTIVLWTQLRMSSNSDILLIHSTGSQPIQLEKQPRSSSFPLTAAASLFVLGTVAAFFASFWSRRIFSSQVESLKKTFIEFSDRGAELKALNEQCGKERQDGS